MHTYFLYTHIHLHKTLPNVWGSSASGSNSWNFGKLKVMYYTNVFVRTCMFLNIYMRMCASTYMYSTKYCTHTHVYTHVCLRSDIYARICAYSYFRYTYPHVYVCVHIYISSTCTKRMYTCICRYSHLPKALFKLSVPWNKAFLKHVVWGTSSRSEPGLIDSKRSEHAGRRFMRFLREKSWLWSGRKWSDVDSSA